MNNVDSFSQRSDEYAKHRPQYPRELFAFFAGLSDSHDQAWDCATGNGQAALACAEFFKKVQATDISKEQIAQAAANPRVTYGVAPAEKTEFADHTFDLVMVAQAVHWFDLEAFYKEVHRVLKPNGVLAVFGYALPLIEPKMDRILQTVLMEAIDSFWAQGNRIIMSGYRDLYFPFAEIQIPRPFAIKVNWTLEQFLNYLHTWSAVKRYIAERGEDPLIPLQTELEPKWGKPNEPRTISMPIFMRVGRTPV